MELLSHLALKSRVTHGLLKSSNQGIFYDIIVESPSIDRRQDVVTGVVRPIVFLSRHVIGQYIIEGLLSGFMFLLGGLGFILLDLAMDKNIAKSVRLSFLGMEFPSSPSLMR
ncbi:hypothetical protein L7F22_042564 [Adiantum nelumboides]|nr:hypothetical protein [Adiantum nelumboides]